MHPALSSFPFVNLEGQEQTNHKVFKDVAADLKILRLKSSSNRVLGKLVKVNLIGNRVNRDRLPSLIQTVAIHFPKMVDSHDYLIISSVTRVTQATS